MRTTRLSSPGRDRGAVIPIVALCLVFLMTMTAFTIDLGRVMVSNRDLQKVSDLVALDLGRRIDGRTVDQINADPAFQQQMLTSASRNQFDITGQRTIGYQLGLVERSTRKFYELHGSSVPNAVRVTAGDVLRYFFVPGTNHTTRSAVGLSAGNATCVSPDPQCAAGIGEPDQTTTTTSPSTTTTTCPSCTPIITYLTTATTDFRVGSFLAGVNLDDTQVKLLNALLSKTGTSVTLDAVSYQGLASTQLTVRQLAAALGLASPNDLFTSTISYSAFLAASAAVLASNGNPQAALTVNNLSKSVDKNKTIQFKNLVRKGNGFRADVGQGPSAFDTYLNFLNLLEASAFLVNGTNAIAIPNLDFGIPGITNVDASLAAVGAPREMLGAHVGDQLTTSQVDLTLTITVDIDISTVQPGGRLRGTIVVRPQSASATASPTMIVCPQDPNPGTAVGVVGSAITSTGSESLVLSLPVAGVNTDVLAVNVPNPSVTAPGATGTATFSYAAEFMPPVASGSMKRVGAQSLNLAVAFDAPTGSALLGIPPIPLPQMVDTVNSALNTMVLPRIENTMLRKIANTLGIEFGGADVGVFGIDCNTVVLVH